MDSAAFSVGVLLALSNKKKSKAEGWRGGHTARLDALDKRVSDGAVNRLERVLADLDRPTLERW
jgi:hypothetical protein